MSAPSQQIERKTILMFHHTQWRAGRFGVQLAFLLGRYSLCVHRHWRTVLRGADRRWTISLGQLPFASSDSKIPQLHYGYDSQNPDFVFMISFTNCTRVANGSGLDRGFRGDIFRCQWSDPKSSCRDPGELLAGKVARNTHLLGTTTSLRRDKHDLLRHIAILRSHHPFASHPRLLGYRATGCVYESACHSGQSLCYLLEPRRLEHKDTSFFCWNQWQCSGLPWSVSTASNLNQANLRIRNRWCRTCRSLPGPEAKVAVLIQTCRCRKRFKMRP